jgi:hypothetical protein
MTPLVTYLLIVTGLLLVALAKLLEHWGIVAPVPAFVESLGVTGASVMVVKLVYDKYLAKESMLSFVKDLRPGLAESVRLEVKSVFGSFETLSANCIAVGIEQLFPSRDLYEARYGLAPIVGGCKPGSTFTWIGNSNFRLMLERDSIRAVLQEGVRIRLCFLNPAACSGALKQLTYVKAGEITSSLETAKELFDDLKQSNTTTAFEVRVHSLLVCDSFVHYTNPTGTEFLAWLPSFGRAETQKIAFVT